MNWDRKATWHGLLALLFILGLIWITLSREPPDVVAARSQRPPSPQVDAPAPDFSLKTLTGETIRLSNLQGQAVLVNFWATWCPPCRAEMPAIQQVYDKYRGQGVTVLAINLQESEAQVSNFAGQTRLTFPILIDQEGTVFARYRVNGLPSTFFVDRQGVIRTVTLGGPMTEAFIDSQVADLLAPSEGQ